MCGLGMVTIKGTTTYLSAGVEVHIYKTPTVCNWSVLISLPPETTGFPLAGHWVWHRIPALFAGLDLLSLTSA